jgi:hypothetical protein
MALEVRTDFMQTSRDSAEHLIAMGLEVAPGDRYVFDLSEPVPATPTDERVLGGDASALGQIRQGNELFGIYAVTPRRGKLEDPAIIILDSSGKQYRLKSDSIADIRDTFSAELGPDSQTLAVINLSGTTLRVHGKQELSADQAA